MRNCSFSVQTIVNTLSHRQPEMAAWGKGKGSWGMNKGPSSTWRGGKGGKTEKKDYVKKVQWNDRLSKYYLRPYVDQQGSPFVLNGQEEGTLLSSWNLGSVLGPDCSEYCARQGIALSEGAANLQVGVGVLQHHFNQSAEEGIQKLGVGKLLEQMDAPEGRKFLEALEYLNTAVEGQDRAQEKTAQAVKRFLRFFKQEAEAKEKLFKKLLRFGARLYLMGFEGLEALAAVSHPEAMAAGVSHVGQQMNLPDDVKTWLQNPKDEEALVWSLVAAFHQQKLDQNKKRKGSHAFDWDEEATAPKGKGWGHHGMEDEDAVEPPPKKVGKGKGGKKTAAQAKAAPQNALASDDEAPGGLDMASSENEEADAEAAVDVTSWPMDEVDAFKALVQEIEEKVENPKDRPNIQKLQEELKKIPAALVKLEGLEPLMEEFLKKTRYPNKAALKVLLPKFKGLASKAEAEWKKSAAEK